jgi:uncharacterized membrane protein
MALYCVDTLLAAFAAWLLQIAVMSTPGHSEDLMNIFMKQKVKTSISMFLNVISIPMAFFYPYVSCILTFIVFSLWVVPSKEIEHALQKPH